MDVDLLKALASHKRLEILDWLSDPVAHFPPQRDGDLVDDGVCGVFIADKLGVSQPAASEHLKLLVRVGLLRSKRIKQWTFYRRDEDRIAEAKRTLSEGWLATVTDDVKLDIDYQPLVGTLEKLDADEVVAMASDQWFNRTLARVDEAVVRIGRFTGGEFPWHKHDDEDEFFFVLDGLVRLDLEDRPSVELGPRQCFTVPKGLLHRPVVTGPATVLMVERASVVATGDA